MWIIEITKNEKGGHPAQYWPDNEPVPEGYAKVNKDECENFPFGDITVEEINGVPTVTSWTPGTMPEPEEPAQPTTEPTVWDELDAAYQEGVDSI